MSVKHGMVWPPLWFLIRPLTIFGHRNLSGIHFNGCTIAVCCLNTIENRIDKLV